MIWTLDEFKALETKPVKWYPVKVGRKLYFTDEKVDGEFGKRARAFYQATSDLGMYLQSGTEVDIEGPNPIAPIDEMCSRIRAAAMSLRKYLKKHRDEPVVPEAEGCADDI